jgi:LysM repeat protein
MYNRLVVVAKVGLVLGVLGLLILPVVAAVGSFAYFQWSDRIVPGVRVAETRLGGRSMYEAAVALNGIWNLERQVVIGVVVDGQTRTWSLSPSQLGLNLDALRSAQNAYAVGHDQDLFGDADEMLASLLRGRQVEPVIVFDPQAARQGLEALSVEVSVPAQEASLRLEGDQLVALPSAAGSVLDVEAGLQALGADPEEVLRRGFLALQMKPDPPRVTDVSQALEAAQRLLDSQATIRAYDPITDEHFKWQVDRQAIASWLRIEEGEGGVQVRLDPEPMAAYFETLSQELGAGREISGEGYAAALEKALRQGDSLTVQIRHLPTTYRVRPGDSLLRISWEVGIPYWKILEANPGLNQDRLLAGQDLTIPSKDEMLPLPLVENKRVVISISKQRLWVYEDGKEISEHVISTGIDRSPTQPGVFQIQTHEIEAYASVWDLYMPHFLGVYEAWPGFMNGIHGLPTLSSGRRLWAGVLGRPVSYGCIVMDLDAAAWLYDWAEDGVVVEIQS